MRSSAEGAKPASQLRSTAAPLAAHLRHIRVISVISTLAYGAVVCNITRGCSL